MRSCALFLSLLLTLVGCPVWADDEIVTGPDRRHEIDLSIAELDAARDAISTTGPKVATFAGLGVSALGGILLGVSTNCPSDSPRCEDLGSDPALLGFGFGLLIAGGATLVAGGIVWGVRSSRIKKIDAKRSVLIQERDGLEAALSRLELRSPYRDGTQFVTLGVRF